MIILLLPLHVLADGNFVGKDGASFSTAPANSVRFSQSAPKEQGTVDSREERSMPSRNPVSKESQASSRINLESIISDPIYAPRSSTKDSLTFHRRMLAQHQYRIFHFHPFHIFSFHTFFFYQRTAN